MKILINVSNNLTGDPDGHKRIYSRYPGDRHKGADHFYIPNAQTLSTVFSLTLWQLRMSSQFKNDKINEIDFVRLQVIDDKVLCHSIEGKYEYSKGTLKLMDKNLVKIPSIDHYFKDEWVSFKYFIETWLNYIAYREGKIEYWKFMSTVEKCIEDIDQKPEKEKFMNRICKIYPEEINDLIINGGNEGLITYSDREGYLLKSVDKISDYKVKEIQEKLENDDIIFVPERIEEFNDGLDMTYIPSEDQIMFEYKDVIHPTAGVEYKDMARIMRKQIELGVFIDDNKLVNFGKLRVLDQEGKNSNFYKTIFNDYGYSYLSGANELNIKGFIRDSFHMARTHKRVNNRTIVKSARALKTEEGYQEEFRRKPIFKNYFEFIQKDSKELRNEHKYLCQLTEEEFKNIDYDYIMTCNEDGISSMTHWRKQRYRHAQKKEIKQMYDVYEDTVYECTCQERLNTIKDNYEEDSKLETLSEKLIKFNEATIWRKK